MNSTVFDHFKVSCCLFIFMFLLLPVFDMHFNTCTLQIVCENDGQNDENWMKTVCKRVNLRSVSMYLKQKCILLS